MGDRNFEWWIAPVGSTSFSESFSSREDAVAAGRATYQRFDLIFADKGQIAYPTGEDLLNVFCDINDELGDPDGDPFGADMEVSREQEDELTGILNSVFIGWLKKHGFAPDVWQFGTVASRETIEAVAV